MKYGKLVRDKVPGRIEAKGEFCRWHEAVSDAEYGETLARKLIEEVGEFAKARIYAELADVMDVLDEVILFHDFEPSVLVSGYTSTQLFSGEEYEDKDLEFDLLMDMNRLAAAFVARPTPKNLVELIRRVWEVAAFQGVDLKTAETARLAKRETHGAFEKRIILDES